MHLDAGMLGTMLQQTSKSKCRTKDKQKNKGTATKVVKQARSPIPADILVDT